MDNVKKILIVFVFILFVSVTVSAAPVIEINVNSNFYQGDLIKFSYTILSQQNEIIEYVASIVCPGSPQALLDLKELSLVRNELFSGEYSYGIVDDNIKNGNCLASISILEPYNLEFKKTFEVSSVSELSITPLICKDSACIEKAKVFIRGEKIYLDYTSSVEGAPVNGILTFPDLSTKKIVLPTSIEADKIGTYELEITASKEGYNTISLKEQFGVIESNANITYENPEKRTITGAGKGVVLSEEQKDLVGKIVKYVIYFLIGIIILIIVLEIIKKSRHRKN